MRLIDADALVAELQKKPIHDGHFIHTRDVSDAIFYAPTLSPDEVREVGEWIDMGDFEQCSCCKGTSLKEFQSYYGKTTWVKTPYCPNCGARMKGAEDGTTE